MDIEQRFGARLRALRAQRDLTQEELSALSGLSVDAISNLERALSVPKLDSVDAIRAGCDMPIWELLDFLGRAEAPDPERQAAEDALLRASRLLNLPLLKVALEQIEVLVHYRPPAADRQASPAG